MILQLFYISVRNIRVLVLVVLFLLKLRSSANKSVAKNICKR